jgi:hypothetical protein
MDNKIQYRNTPRGVDAEGDATVPSAYTVKQFSCINSEGRSFDISPLVVSFTITEELFSPVIVLNLKMRDTINFFEDFALIGQERIIVHLERLNKKEKGKVKRLKMSFAVKEYPNYTKTAAEPNVQEYNIIAVSEFAYSSMLQRLSRSVKGNPIDGIKKIFNDDLNISFENKSVCASTFDGIITIQSPLKAIEWLRSKAFDSSGAPFFVYSTVSSDKVVASSLSDLWSNKNDVFRTYQYRQLIHNRVGTEEFYAENATRVLNMRSNIKLDKLVQATKGGFASKTNVTDVTGKTFTEIVFDYSKDSVVSSNRIDMKSPFQSAKSLFVGNKSSGGKSLSDLSDASITNLSANSAANYQGNQNSSSGPMRDNISRAKSYYANLDAVTHTIVVYGEFELNPGKKIRLEIPKAVDMGRYSRKDSDDILDKSMSGVYLIAVAAHSFNEGIYTSRLQIIKDS